MKGTFYLHPETPGLDNEKGFKQNLQASDWLKCCAIELGRERERERERESFDKKYY